MAFSAPKKPKTPAKKADKKPAKKKTVDVKEFLQAKNTLNKIFKLIANKVDDTYKNEKTGLSTMRLSAPLKKTIATMLYDRLLQFYENATKTPGKTTITEGDVAFAIKMDLNGGAKPSAPADLDSMSEQVKKDYYEKLGVYELYEIAMAEAKKAYDDAKASKASKSVALHKKDRSTIAYQGALKDELNVSPMYVRSVLKALHTGKVSIGKPVAAMVAAYIEYMATELLEVAIKYCYDNTKMKTVMVEHLSKAVKGDPGLSSVFDGDIGLHTKVKAKKATKATSK